MSQKINGAEGVNRRHLLGFRRFQNAALRALSVLSAALKEDRDGGDRARERSLAVKVGDMKSLVSAYKDAVAGERTVLGLGGAVPDEWPEEMVVRWVDDEPGKGCPSE